MTTPLVTDAGPELLAQAVRVCAVHSEGKTQEEAENVRKMIFALSSDVRVIILRLERKLQALQAIDNTGTGAEASASAEASAGAAKTAAQECLSIDAPLADRLGLQQIKDELEDSSLKILNPDAWGQINALVSLGYDEREAYLKKVSAAIAKEAARNGLKVSISSRAKHYYSIYLKMRKRGKAASEIYDFFGLRIICQNDMDCYIILGLVHKLWKPVNGRFKDYIAHPKANGYRSLHTTVLTGPDETMLEIQIRSAAMHEAAEFGLASHWLYKRGKAGEAPVRDEDLQGENSFEALKVRLLKNDVVVFTPQGKVQRFPAGATALDFAYKVHSAIGEHCSGSKADGSIIPLSLPLKTGQVVEILTSPQAHPHPAWLEMAKTPRARSKIRSWLLANDPTFSDSTSEHDRALEAAREAARETPKKSPASVTRPFRTPAAKPVAPDAPLRVTIDARSEKNMLLHFAQCCKARPGQPIVGYVSRGRGIIIHRADCPRLAEIPDFEKRSIAVAWEENKD
jgi:GTP pyrophosphokinase